MQPTLKRSITGAAGVALAFVLAACSSGATPATTSSAAAGSTAGAAATSAASSNEGYAKDSDTLIFGSVPASEGAENSYKPIEEYITQVTGKKVEYFQAADYVALIEAAVAGQIDFAAFSGFTYYQATQAGADIEPFAAVVAEEGSEAGYYSVAIANPNAGIESIADFKGKKVAFVNPNSTSGYLYPSYLLLDNQIDPSEASTDITVSFSGKHDAVLLDVQTGAVDAGFAEDAIADPAIADGSVKEINRVFVAGPPFVVSGSLPQETKDQIIDALTNITADDLVAAGITSANDEAFRDIFWSLEPIDDAYYDTIRDLCKIVTTAEACQQ